VNNTDSDLESTLVPEYSRFNQTLLQGNNLDTQCSVM